MKVEVKGGKAVGFSKIFTALHQELIKQEAVKFRKNIRSPEARRRIISAIKLNQLAQETGEKVGNTVGREDVTSVSG